MNPYASTGSVSTVTSSISGSDNAALSAGGGPGGGLWDTRAPSRMPARAVIARMLARLGARRMLLAAAFVLAVASVLLQLVVPLITGRAIDLILGPGRVAFAQLGRLLAILAATVAAAALCQWLQGAALNRLTYQTARDLRVDAGSKLHRLPISAIDAHPHGDLASRVVNDVDQVADGLLQGTTQLFCGIVTIVGTLVFMCSVSWFMALVVVVVTPLSVAAAAAIARHSNASFADQQRLQGELAAHIDEYVGNQHLVSAYGQGPRAEERFEGINRALYTAGEHAQFLSSLSNPGTRFINNLIYAVVAVIGCLCAIGVGPVALTVGGVQVFLSYASQYTKPFSDITGVIGQIQTAVESARRVFELLDAPEVAEETEGPDAAAPVSSAGPVLLEPAPAKAPAGAVEPAAPVSSNPAPAGAPFHGEVAFHHVDFSYIPGTPVLHDICLHARPGQHIALVGPTGCGKTTLINLLLRFYHPSAGRITLDGRNIEDIDRSELRRSFGMVLQESWLFEGTVAQNIAYGRPEATRAEVERAARAAHAGEFIEALPQGYDTVIGEGGDTLSAGQRQLICIARVMLADPPILLLDEATSSIDTRTELAVQAAFDELMRGRTSLVVAHRLSTVRRADCILVMRDGRIVERGTHEELLAAGGFYAQMVRA